MTIATHIPRRADPSTPINPNPLILSILQIPVQTGDPGSVSVNIDGSKVG